MKFFIDTANLEQIKEAQDLGYAESDSSADVDGHDACRKIAILSSLAYGMHVDFKDIYTEGISSISDIDIKYAKEINGHIKLLATSKKVGDQVLAMVSPMIIKPDNNVLNVVYVKDITQTKELEYTVEYYKDNKLTETKTDKEVVWVNDSDLIAVDFDLINTTDKYIGYSFSHMTPEKVSEEVRTGTTIKIYYEINYYNYEVNYYKDSISKENLIDSIENEAKYQEVIEIEELLNLPEGYTYNGEEVELTIDVENNIVNIVYEKETYEYTVEYYYDGKIDEEKTDILSALYGTEITDVEDKSYGNYIISKTENLPLVIDTEDNIIKVYYVESGIGGDIIEPPKTGNNNYLSVLLILISLLIIKLK